MVLPGYQDYKRRGQINELLQDGQLCYISKNQFLNFVGGAAAGTAISSSIAGDSVVIIITQAGILAGSAPAIAPAVTLAAVGTTAAYATLKAYCSRHEATDVVMKWHTSTVDKTSVGMKIFADEYGKLIDKTSAFIGDTATNH